MNWSPYSSTQPQTTTASKPKLFPIIASVLIVVVSIWFLNQDKSTPNPNNDDIVIVEPDDKEDKKVEPKTIQSLKDTYVVRVYETETDGQPVWLTKILNADAFWIDWFGSQGMVYHTIDPTSNKTQAESFLAAAKKFNVSVPFYIHAKPGGSVISVNSFKDGLTVDDIKKSLESKVK